MNRTEHLLTCLAEECAEVQQAIAKALRFGLDDGYPGTSRTNAEDIAKELSELVAVSEMLMSDGVIDGIDRNTVDEKKDRVRHWMHYAEQRGTLVHNAELKGSR